MALNAATRAAISLSKVQGVWLLLIAAVGLSTGLICTLLQDPIVARLAWTIATLPILGALLRQVFRSLRRGDFGLDIVAALSMAFALAFGEPLAANVVALMYAGGQMLEGYASRRAAREMTALMGRVAQTAFRYDKGGLQEVPITEIKAGDRLMVRQGEVIPVDGIVVTNQALLDESALTGEAIPRKHGVNDEVLSGSTSLAGVFDMRAIRPASESTYAAVIRLVKAAQESKAPMARLADRYGLMFLVVTVSLALAAWFVSSDPRRALAVLVIATPCPLILAVPVAIMSGISRCAAVGCLVKDGGVLEALSRVRVAVLDKTGTLTHGMATIVAIKCAEWIGEDELLRLAASLDQASGHVMAAALISAARERGLNLALPADVSEFPGEGIEGTVDQRHVVVGGSRFVERRVLKGSPRAFLSGRSAGEAVVAVAVDSVAAGLIVMADPVRPEAIGVLRRLRDAGIARIILASGDRLEVARGVGEALGIEEVLGEQSPASKVDCVNSARHFGPVMMVGDGINDAPALAAADVGVALGARGAAASSEAAGVVLLVDRLDPLAIALTAASRTIVIARQSVIVGLGLSMAGMVAAACGFLLPVQGALLQEVIDVAVILNALRALRPVGSESKSGHGVPILP
ncbi:heavy metal translocating P-type ATPase [Rhizobium sp. P32RR-XVIII]|uniref:heavy metal translocating P-type ATPase n=1 Tax=Rhizobium sp. P32RR-XVIII TaxID=2726738 RepID=UPI001456774B|nr:heavy metal translocating P-type ATPase [Rhizobium sp. P32RR-XVIII]NLS07886.1 heavy metal translocating P-type ATPase [Rhizobium sp. P32RR-XVIII]